MTNPILIPVDKSESTLIARMLEHMNLRFKERDVLSDGLKGPSREDAKRQLEAIAAAHGTESFRALTTIAEVLNRLPHGTYQHDVAGLESQVNVYITRRSVPPTKKELAAYAQTSFTDYTQAALTANHVRGKPVGAEPFRNGRLPRDTNY